jgi:hypothetical protein
MWFKTKKATAVAHSEQVIREYSFQRLAKVFGMPKSSLSDNDRFGHELVAAPASDFSANAYDVIDGDIKDVADKKILKDMAEGKLTINTVADYCDHMVRCNLINAEEVAHILQLPKMG